MAGSWGNARKSKGSFGGVDFQTISIEGTCDATDGSIPSLAIMGLLELENQSGVLLGTRVSFDGDNTPAEWDMAIAEGNGIDLLGGAGAGANKFTDSGKISLSPAEPFQAALYLVVAIAAANANAGAKATVEINVIL